jgi:hypothetical protein
MFFNCQGRINLFIREDITDAAKINKKNLYETLVKKKIYTRPTQFVLHKTEAND